MQYPFRVSDFSIPLPLIPVPVNTIFCGLPGALWVTETVPVRSPEVPGMKVTLIMQFAPDVRVEPQSLVSSKWGPAAPIRRWLSIPVPELPSVMICAGLGAPTASLPKVKLVADKVALGDPLIDPPPQPLSKQSPRANAVTVERHVCFVDFIWFLIWFGPSLVWLSARR
jgi:hypothetical protein